MDKNVMLESIKEAEKTMKQNIGGPFGAAIVRDGKIIVVTSNSVLQDNDPTAHAEVNAIRKASSILKTHDLSGCELYATGYPCPMCLAAAVWANIKTIYYCNDVKQAEKIGFRDDFIYNFIKSGCADKSLLKLERLELPEGSKLYEDYESLKKVIY